ncbi:MAG: hypothetical protein ACYC9Y_16175 [Candidatus Methylomirabilia bacterium]
MRTGRLPTMLCAAALLTAPAPVRGAGGSFDVRLGAEVRYDYNVFEYSDADRNLFDPARERFRGLGSVDDWVVAPRARVEYRWRGTYDTRLALAGAWAFYESNGVKDYQSFSLRLARKLPWDAELTLRYSLVPRFFFKRLADPPGQTGTYADATFRIDTFRAALGKRITDRIELAGWGQLERSNYNAAFDERDITKLGGGADITVKAAGWLRLRAGASLEEGVARGENDPATGSDISYWLWAAHVSSQVRISDRVSFGVGYAREQKHFTTGLINDRSHYRRRDATDTLEADVRMRLGGSVALTLGIEHSTTRAERDGQRLGFASFTDNLYTMQVTYEF